MQATSFKEQDLKRIELIMFKFIWNIKANSTRSNGRISRTTIKQEYENGGLKAPDIFLINRSIKYKHYLRCHYNNHPISRHTVGRTISTVTGVTNNNKLSSYIEDAVATHLKFKQLVDDDVKLLISENSKINRSYISYFQNLSLQQCNFFNKNQLSMIMKLKKFHILNVFDLINEYKSPRSYQIRFETFQCYNTLPSHVKTLLSNHQMNKYETVEQTLPYKLNIWKNVKNITSKDIRNRFSSKLEANILEYLENKHKNVINTQNITSNPFVQINKTTPETRNQDTQYKILHNIYPTIRNLYKWRIKDTDQCQTCSVTDNLKHCIFDCFYAKQCFDNLTIVLQRYYGIRLSSLSYENILLGTRSSQTILEPNLKASIDTILILLKRKLILSGTDKQILTEAVIEGIIQSQIKLEKRITNATQFSRKWRSFLVGNIN